MKRKCSNCYVEIEYNELHRSDLIFCSVKCNDEFMIKDSNIRKKLGWKELIKIG